jgi:hypothetical protein
MSVQLLKFLDVPWEVARGYLREDLDHLEVAINAGGLGGSGGGGTGPGGLIDLTADVVGRLPFSHLVAATAGGILIGRPSGAGGDFAEITLGSGLGMAGSVLSSTAHIHVFEQQTEPLSAVEGDVWIST